MSKKKSKPAARKAPTKAAKNVVKKKAVKKKAVKKKAVKKTAAKRSAPASRATATLTAAPARRTKTATIFIFKTDKGTRIRTSPQRLYANPGDAVEFNVVNMIDDDEVPVTIVFPDGGPWGKDPFEIRNWDRKPTGDAPLGRFKYTITALDAEEDPEIELPDGM